MSADTHTGVDESRSAPSAGTHSWPPSAAPAQAQATADSDVLTPDLRAPLGTRLARARRRAGSLARVIGVGPVVLLMTAGLLPVVAAASSSRVSGATLGAQTLYLLGLLIIAAPAAIGVTLPRVRESTPVVLALAMTGILQVSYLLLRPVGFATDDELVHANSLRQIDESGHLFTVNPLGPTTSDYPGLQVATKAVHDLTGLALPASAAALLIVVRLVVALAILLLVAHVTRSTRIGAVAVVLYAANPQMLLGDAAFSPRALTLALGVLAAYLVVSRRRGPRVSLVVAVLAVVALAFTDPLATVVFVAILVVWAGLDALRPGPQGSLRAIAAVAVAGLVALSVAAARAKVNGSGLGVLGGNGTDQPGPLAPPAGAASLPWAAALVLGAYATTLVLLVAGLVRSRLFVPTRIPVAVLLSLVSLLFPVLLWKHLTGLSDGVSTGFGAGAWGLAFVGVAFVVAWWFYRARPRWWRSVLLGLAATVMVIGGVLSGAGSLGRLLPSPPLVADGTRGVDADHLAAISWLSTNAPAGSRVYADPTGTLLLSLAGRQTPVSPEAPQSELDSLLHDGTVNAATRTLVRKAGIRYLVLDHRPGEATTAEATTGAATPAQHRFAAEPGVDVVYDSGSIVIYDLEALSAPAQ